MTGTIAFLVILLLVFQFYCLRLAKAAVSREQRAVGDREEVVGFLNRFAHSIVTSTDSRAWMGEVATYVGDAVGASAVRIFMREDARFLKVLAGSGEFPKIPEGDTRLTKANRLLEHLNHDRIEIGEGLVGEMIFSGKSVHLAQVDDDPNARLQTLIAVPMVMDEENVGVLCAADKRHGGSFSTDDLFLLESLSGQVALGGTLFEVYENLNKQNRIQQELDLAREIQTWLLPTEAPQCDWFSIHGFNNTAGEVSGDFFDFVEINDDFLLILIADASGKGVPACMIMAMCRSFIRANASRYKDNLEGLLKELNSNLFDDTHGAKFVTLACCLIDKADGTIEYARAGHTELVIKQPTGNIQIICPDGPALGLLPDDMDVQYDTFSFSWLPQTSILLFTDGITEALNDDEEEYGLERLLQCWREQGLDPESASTAILEDVNRFTQSHPQSDDQTIVVLSRTA